MRPTPVGKIMHFLVLLILLSFTKISLAAPEEKTFFSHVDAAIQGQKQSNSVQKKLIVERYLRLLARLDIFGLYCDRNNRMGYSTRVAALQRGSVRLERWTEEIFGSIGAYNRFEKSRTQESLRYVRSERARTCDAGKARFLFFTGMDPKDFRIYLSDPPFGSL